MPQVTPHSGPVKTLKHNATRKSMATPANHYAPIPHSGTKPGMPMASNDNIGAPYAKASDRMEQKFTTKPMVTPHSGAAVPRAPKRWNRKPMAMGVPVTMPNE